MRSLYLKPRGASITINLGSIANTSPALAETMADTLRATLVFTERLAGHDTMIGVVPAYAGLLPRSAPWLRAPTTSSPAHAVLIPDARGVSVGRRVVPVRRGCYQHVAKVKLWDCSSLRMRTLFREDPSDYPEYIVVHAAMHYLERSHRSPF